MIARLDSRKWISVPTVEALVMAGAYDFCGAAIADLPLETVAPTSQEHASSVTMLRDGSRSGEFLANEAAAVLVESVRLRQRRSHQHRKALIVAVR